MSCSILLPAASAGVSRCVEIVAGIAHKVALTCHGEGRERGVSPIIEDKICRRQKRQPPAWGFAIAAILESSGEKSSGCSDHSHYVAFLHGRNDIVILRV